ncbi:hypothetical protein IAD21_02894 [Abditibacteriota bacterium]|nr:hypothetical protein IAD21_02894 [Abditibacteriota bacterium]
MLPRSKAGLAFLIALPLLLVIPLWQAAQKRPRLWGVLTAPAASLALSRDGQVVAFRTSNGAVELLPRAGTRRLLQTEGAAMQNPSYSAYSPAKLRFASDDHTLLASNIRTDASSTGLYAWDAGTGNIKWSALSPFTDDLCRYWVSSDGKRAVQRSYDVVKVLDISGEGARQNSKKSNFARAFPVLTRFLPNIKEPTGGKSLPQTLALSADGKTIVLATQGGALEFWDVVTGKRQSQTTPSGASTSADWELQYSPDGRFVALFDGTTISIWDTTTRKWSANTVTSASSEVALAWMADSHSLWTGAGTVQQWSVPELKSLRDLPVSGPVAVSGDGRTLVTRALGQSGGMSGIWAWNLD